MFDVLLFSIVLFFFFKQKTAYEMRISDWSSDVCSSDLLAEVGSARAPVPAFDAQLLKTPVWTFDPAVNRFTFGACADLVAHPRCEVACHASISGIEERAGVVQRVEARSLKGGRLMVVADAVVLTAGGIENARLLLASDIGNAYDPVGPYFM